MPRKPNHFGPSLAEIEVWITLTAGMLKPFTQYSLACLPRPGSPHAKDSAITAFGRLSSSDEPRNRLLAAATLQGGSEQASRYASTTAVLSFSDGSIMGFCRDGTPHHENQALPSSAPNLCCTTRSK